MQQSARSLARFLRLAWPVVEPAVEFVPGWHIDAIVEHLEAVSRGQIRNLLINVPPRHCKSLLVAVFWPVWEWIDSPHRRWLYSAYAQSLSTRDSLKCRRLIQSPWFQDHFGDRFVLRHDQNEKFRFENDHGGYRLATSVGGSATGEEGDRVVVDDPHQVSDRESDAVREAALVWWDQTMSTRLNDPRTGARVIVMQRIHEKDLSGHVLRQGGYEHLCLPAEFEPARRCVTSLGWQDPRNDEAALLWPARLGPAEIAEARLRLGPTGFAGQFQQRPVPAGGGRFEARWFRYYRNVLAADRVVGYRLLHPDGSSRVVAADACDRFATMDPAGAEPDGHNRPCYTVIQVWDVTPAYEMILVHQYRAQVQAPQAAEEAVRLVHRLQVPRILIEKDGIGLGVVQTVRARGVAVRPQKARGNKLARSETAEIRLSAGTVYFSEKADWLFAFEEELLSFPKSPYSDQVDAFAYAALHVQKIGGPPGEGVEKSLTQNV